MPSHKRPSLVSSQAETDWSKTTQRSGPQEGQAASRQLSMGRGAAPMADQRYRQECQGDGCRTKLDPQRQIGSISATCQAHQANGTGCTQADGDRREPGQ